LGLAQEKVSKIYLKIKQDMVDHVYNPTYSGGRAGGSRCKASTRQKLKTPCEKAMKAKWLGV
jgi:hypothetical protein